MRAADRPGGRDTGSTVRAAYDAVAGDHDANRVDDVSGKPLDRALLHAFVDLVGDGTIADVGCGPGRITRFLAERHRDVIGIDLSPKMIMIARDRSPDLPFAVGSMVQLPPRTGRGRASSLCTPSST